MFFLTFFLNQGFSFKDKQALPNQIFQKNDQNIFDHAIFELETFQNISLEKMMRDIKIVLSNKNDKKKAENFIKKINWEKISKKIDTVFSLEKTNVLKNSIKTIINAIFCENNHQDLCIKVLNLLNFEDRVDRLNDEKFVLLTEVILLNKNHSKIAKSMTNKKNTEKFNYWNIFSLVKNLFFNNNSLEVYKKAIKIIDLKERVPRLSDENFILLIRKILSKRNTPEVASQALNFINLGAQINKRTDNVFILLIKEILSSENSPEIAQKALDSVNFRKRVEELSDTDFILLIKEILSSENSPEIAQKTLASVDLKERVNKISYTCFSSLIEEIVSNKNNVNISIKAIEKIYLNRKNGLVYLYFIDLILVLLSEKSHCDLSKKVIDFIKPELSTLSGYSIFRLIEKIIHGYQAGNLSDDSSSPRKNLELQKKIIENINFNKINTILGLNRRFAECLLDLVISSDYPLVAQIVDQLCEFVTINENDKIIQKKVLHKIFTNKEIANILLSKMNFSSFKDSDDVVCEVMTWCFQTLHQLKAKNFENADTTVAIKLLSKLNIKKGEKTFWQNVDLALRLMPFSKSSKEVECFLSKLRCDIFEDFENLENINEILSVKSSSDPTYSDKMKAFTWKCFFENIQNLEEIFKACSISNYSETVNAFTNQLNFDEMNKHLLSKTPKDVNKNEHLEWYSSGILLRNILRATNESFAQTCLEKINFWGGDLTSDIGKTMTIFLFETKNTAIGNFLIEKIHASFDKDPLDEVQRDEFIKTILASYPAKEELKTKLMERLNWKEFFHATKSEKFSDIQ
ncbi:hypothetical protein [Holospora obtusa]|uniref:hypothetical protein n=1 Tax=Holospora obtusa TaxID=49893 RepID=UPI0012EC4CC9|nr:hypothetical protein [Holospora obtusa]